jgi:hypothetical protein
MNRFAKFALPAALALAALGAQATELYTPNTVQGGTTAASVAAAPVDASAVFAPSAVNRFERSTAAVTRSGATTPRDVYAPSIVNQTAGTPAGAPYRALRSAMPAPSKAAAGVQSPTGQRDIDIGA